MSFLEWLRAVNAVLALAAVTMVIAMATEHWSEYEERAKWVTVSFVSLLIATVYGSIESFLTDTPGSPRSIIVTFSCICVVLAQYRGDRMFKRPGKVNRGPSA